MAGFLDKNNQIIDMVLTGEGRYLLSRGELDFMYWVAFDDEVDYSPYVGNSSSLDSLQLSASIVASIEDTCPREPTTGYRRYNRLGVDHTSVLHPIFEMPHGQTVLPRVMPISTHSGSITIDQQKVFDLYEETDEKGNVVQSIQQDVGVERTNASSAAYELGFAKDSFPAGHTYEGFLVRVYESGSDGLNEIGQQNDLKNDVSFGSELKIFAGGAYGTSR